MAAAIVPIVLAGVQLALPLIEPAILQVEQVLGGRNAATGKVDDGPARMQTAVNVIMAGLQVLANAPKTTLSSAAVLDPALPAALQAVVQKAYDAMKASGQLTQPAVSSVPSATPAASAAPPSQPVAQVVAKSGSAGSSGSKVVITIEVTP